MLLPSMSHADLQSIFLTIFPGCPNYYCYIYSAYLLFCCRTNLQQYQALSAGFGFGAFVYILAFVLLFAAAVYMSPMFCGSPNEVKMIRTPQVRHTLSHPLASHNHTPYHYTR